MTVSVTMPQLGESVTEGTVTRWLKAEGDQVQADEPLLEVSTDKVDTEIPAPASGVLVRITAREDDVVLVGGELGVIGDSADANAGEVAPAAPPAQAATAAPVEATEVAPAEELESAPEAEAAPAPEPASVPEAEPAPVAADNQPVEAAAPASSGASTPVVLPALGESVTEGTVTRWLKAVGDAVQADEPLVEVSTDKVDTELPAPVSGILLEITADEDSTVLVGAQLGLIGSAAGSTAPTPAPAAAPTAAAPAVTPAPAAAPPVAAVPPAAPPAAAPPAAAPPVAPPAASAPDAPAPTAGAAPVADEGADSYVTPLVRKLATEHQIDLSSLTGTGIGGRIRKQDVLEAAEARKDAELAAARAAATAATVRAAADAPAPAPAAAPAAPSRPANAIASALRGRTEPMSRLRKVIAERMLTSLQTSAQLTTVVEVDVTRIAALRQRAKRDFESREGVKLSFLPFFAKAAIEALKAYPSVNASIDTDAGTVTYHEAEHLGVAVDTERGLLVPVIRDAGDLSIGGLARKITDLADRTRNNKITPDELSGGTFTLTNTGSRGALFDTPIINQPQVAILGTGAVVKRPIVVTDPTTGTDGIAIRSMVYLALTYDHRLVDGADAARFLVTMKSRLEEGAFESDLGV